MIIAHTLPKLKPIIIIAKEKPYILTWSASDNSILLFQAMPKLRTLGKAEIQEALSMMKSEDYPENLSSRLPTCKLKELQIDLNDGTITKVYDRLGH